MWSNINLNCIDPNNSNVILLVVLEHIWTNRNLYNKNFYNLLEKLLLFGIIEIMLFSIVIEQ